MQIRTFEGSLLISVFEARQRGDHAMEEFFLHRLRPDSLAIFSEWEKLDPANNPEAPRNPFLMPSYRQFELVEAQRFDELLEQEHAAAFHANKTSDGYVLLTVLFASVLFFGGVSGTFGTPRLRISALGISIVLLTQTMFALATMPICRN